MIADQAALDELIEAIRSKNIEGLRDLVAPPNPADQVDPNFFLPEEKEKITPLTVAITKNWREGVACLLEADSVFQRIDGKHPIDWAIDQRYFQVASCLIKKAAERENTAPIFLVIRSGSKEIFEILLREPVDFTEKNTDQRIPLEEAIHRGLWRTACFILKEMAAKEIAYNLDKELKTGLLESTQYLYGKDRVSKWLQTLEPKQECPVCFESSAVNTQVSCEANETHLICSICLKAHAEDKLGSFQYRLNCVAACSSEFNLNHKKVKEALGDALVTKLDVLSTKAAARQANIQLTGCPFCGMAPVDYTPDEDNPSHFYCPECLKISCLDCSREKHNGPCLSLFSTLQLRVEDAMNRARGIVSCPGCSVSIDKIGGCNEGHCTHCGTDLCMACGKNLKPIGATFSLKQAHFFGENKTCSIGDVCDTCGEEILEEGLGHFNNGQCTSIEVSVHDDVSQQREKWIAKKVEQAKQNEIVKIISEHPDLKPEEIAALRSVGEEKPTVEGPSLMRR